ncbi:MAG: biotin--[acetyl-CoA-carboxylase] ligase [Actinomycetes bacterium]
MASPWSDLQRPPLRERDLRRALVESRAADHGPRLWTSVDVLATTGSTNADLAERLRLGRAAPGAVLVAETQTSGRGRLGRSWSTPPRAALAVSVALRPKGVPASRWGWLPLLAGLAVRRAVRQVAEVDTVLKWPNDVLVAQRADGNPAIGPRAGKLAGILSERVDTLVGPHVVLGIGLNVSQRAEELVVDTATSLALAGGGSLDRDSLLRAVLRELASGYLEWQSAGGDPEATGLRAAYLAASGTIGQRVRVDLPGGRALLGQAVAVDADGALVVQETGHGEPTTVAAGDVVHLRPDSAPEPPDDGCNGSAPH